MVSWRAGLAVASLLVAAAVGIYLFENRGLPRDGWQVFLGEGPEPTMAIEGTSGVEAALNVTPDGIEGRPSLHGRYVGSLAAESDLELRFRTDSTQASLEVQIADAEIDCPLDEAIEAAGEAAGARYRVDAEPGLCRVSLQLSSPLVDDTDGAPVEWTADLHDAGPPWWFSFEAASADP